MTTVTEIEAPEQAEAPAPSEVPTDPPAARATFLTVLRHAGFRNLWLGQIVSQIGDYFALLALMVVVSGFSNKAADTTQAVSGLMIAFSLPRLLFGVLAGVFVDRWDRRRTMLGADVTRGVLALALIPAFLTHNLLLVYALAFVMSAFGTLFNPAKSAIIPRLVPTEQLTAANALSQTSQMLATFIGPALAGLTFAAVGKGNEWVAFAVDGLSFAVSAVAVWSIAAQVGSAPARPVTSDDTGAVRRVWDELRVGLRALLGSRTMATLSAVMGITMLGIGAMNVLWIVYLKTRFGFEAADLAGRIAILDIAFSAGMVLVTVLVGNLLSGVAPKWLVVGGLTIGGLLLLPIGYIPDYWLLVALMFGIGLGVGPINAGISSLMQIVVPNSQMGRVSGGFGTIIDMSMLLSVSMAGALGGWLGIPAVLLLSGLFCIGGGVLALTSLPALTLKDKVEEAPLAAVEEQAA